MRRIPSLVILAGMMLVGLALGTVYFQHPATLALPTRLANLSLHHRSLGPAAIDELSGVHERWLPLSAGAVGYYGTDREVTLWIASAPNAWLAGRMVAAMNASIARCDTEFHPAGEKTHLGHQIYEVTGLERSHFYYQTGHLIVWLSVDPELAEVALAQVLEDYR